MLLRKLDVRRRVQKSPPLNAMTKQLNSVQSMLLYDPCIAEVVSPFEIFFIATNIKYRILIYLRRIRNLSTKAWMIRCSIPGKINCSF